MKKVLIIIPKNIYVVKYPHLFDFIDEYKKKYEVEILLIPERGYWIEKYIEKIKKTIFKKKGAREIFLLIKFLLTLFRKSKYHYEYVISIDNLSYVFACSFLKNKNHVLWSHDFVSHDNGSHENYYQRKIQRYTRKHLLQYRKIIIQSARRYELFLKSININEPDSNRIEVKYLPVSLKDISLLKFRNTDFINKESITLIQIGGINQPRSKSCDLISEYQKIDNLKLILHGFISSEVTDFVSTGNLLKVPIFSNINLPPEGVMKLLSDADIGFVSYKATDENFANITWASGQIAEHTRARLPVIAHGDTSLNDFVKEYNIGIGIKDMKELSDAIKKIKSDYDGYSRRSRKLFDEKMNISKYVPFEFT